MSKYDDLVKKLREIFQIDKPDLDFGIYRIINQRAEQIDNYLKNTLREKVETGIGKRQNADTDSKRADLIAQIRDEFGKRAFDETGNLTDADALASELGKQLTALDAGAATNAEHENAVFSHLLTFFARYYDKADFISQRRYKGDTYAIPYSGEEVMLHWANKDQYYIKSGENFSNYTFKLDDGRKVHFRLVSADTAKDNRKDNDKDRRFALVESKTVVRTDDEGEEYEETIVPIEECEVSEGGETTTELVLRFEYIPVDKKTKQEALITTALKRIFDDATIKARWLDLSARKPTENNPQRTVLEKNLTDYTSKNSSDYFIHKDLSGFLSNELDFYIKNEVMHLDDVQDAEKFADIEKSLRMIQCFRAIGQELIRFLAQIEDFQKKLWLKKKFVVETNYCITLDRVPEELYPEITANDAQREEWVKLFAIDQIKGEEGDLVSEGRMSYTAPLEECFLKENNKLVLDTKHFNRSFKASLLSKIENLNDECCGLLVHSENQQALNFLHLNYSNSVRCIYIDPPYNTGQDEFIYKDSYQRSSWATMLHGRLNMAKAFMENEGAIAISIDENEIANLLTIMDDVFGKENRVGIATVKRGSVTGHKAINKGIVNITEQLVMYARVKSEWKPKRAFKGRGRNDRYNNFIKHRSEATDKWAIVSLLDAFSEYKAIPKSQLRKNLGNKYEKEIYDFVKNNATSVIQLAYPDESNVSKDAQVAIQVSRKDESNIHHFKRDGVPDMYLKGGQRLLFYSDRLVEIDGEIMTAEPLSDIWDDILPNDLHNEGGVSLKKGKKPEKLLNRIYEVCCESGDLVLDFFLGSGTCAATALKKGLRFIGVEQGEYFDEKALVRLKLVNMFKKKHEKVTSFFFKYIRLESYEDTLNNLQLKRNDSEELFTDELKDDYLLNYMLDVESQGSLLSVDDFKKPFEYTLKIAADSAGAFTTQKVDLVETFNYLIGLRVKHIDGQLERGYVTVEGTLPSEERCLVLWRDCEQVDYDALNKLCEKLQINPKDSEYDLVYINGDHNIPSITQETENEGGISRSLKLRQIEPEFLQRMFEVEDV